MRLKHLRNRIRQRGFQVQETLGGVDTGIRINIQRNPSKQGKRYIAKMYKDGELIASYPADEISDIDLKFFNP